MQAHYRSLLSVETNLYIVTKTINIEVVQSTTNCCMSIMLQCVRRLLRHRCRSYSQARLQRLYHRQRQRLKLIVQKVTRTHSFKVIVAFHPKQESCTIAKMTARCAAKSKQPHLHLRSRDSRLTLFNRTLWT